MFGRSVPEERPSRPFTGFKLAQPLLSADDTRAGFAGLSIGARQVYGVSADASCVWNRRHMPPRRRCGCGFYCLRTIADARALTCATDNRSAALLEVAASGRYIRYERGLRYSRQRVQAVRFGQCRCGRPPQCLADAGNGFVGWRILAAACAACAGQRPAITFGDFQARLDERAMVGPDTEPAAGPRASPPPNAASRGEPPQPSAIAVLTAEIALVHARLDDLQARVARQNGGPGNAS